MNNHQVRNGAKAFDSIQQLTFGRYAQKFGEAYARWDAARKIIEHELTNIDRDNQAFEDGKPQQKLTEQGQFAIFSDPLKRTKEREEYLSMEYEGELPRIKASWLERHLRDPRTGAAAGQFFHDGPLRRGVGHRRRDHGRH